METQRLFLFAALSAVLLLIWQAWEQDQRPLTPSATTAAPNPGAPAAIPDVPVATAPDIAPTAPADKTVSSARIRVTTDLIDTHIDTVGGDPRTLSLLKHPVEVSTPNEPFELLRDSGSEIFMVQSGLIGSDGAYPSHKTQYRAEKTHYTLAEGANHLDVRLLWRSDALQVTKVLRFHRNSYVIDVRYEVANTSDKPRSVYVYHQFLRTHVANNSYFNVAPSYTGGAIYSPDQKYQKIDFADIADKWPGREVPGGWVAMLQHYFVGAAIPPQAQTHRFYSEALPGARYVLGYKSVAPTTVAPGAQTQLAGSYYLGPKEQVRLEKVAPGLILTVDYGWLTVIAAPLYWVLEKIHDFVGNWGWAIVVLTLFIKLAFYPLSAASYKSMAHMRKLQPRLVGLKERYGNDRQKMNQAMMELYKTEKINPLGGCLPILIQIPVFIALYWVLLESVELRQAPWILWINDLSTPDRFFVLPIIMGVTMVLQQMLNPSPLDPLQKKIMMALPVLFTVFFLFFASGLVLYWVVNNVLSIAQQWWITRAVERGAKT